MLRNFLTAKWEYLVMFNYEVDAKVLLPYLPPHTQLDYFNGKALVSVVGFLFNQTKVMGISWPWHKNFEEVNLRFYVKHWDGKVWRRGVAFISEIVPKQLVATLANVLYNEHYSVAKMKHSITQQDEKIAVQYQWKTKSSDFNRMQVIASNRPLAMQKNSMEEFILEHYYGYNKYNSSTTIEYSLKHPSWQVYPVTSYSLDCAIGKLYGNQFVTYLQDKKPDSVFLAKGSKVSVQFPRKIRK